MKGKLVLATLSLVIGTQSFAGWSKRNYQLKNKKMKKEICTRIADVNDSHIDVDVKVCGANGTFKVVNEYYSTLGGKNYKTLKKVKTKYEELACTTFLEKDFGGLKVDNSGNVYKAKADWTVKSTVCKLNMSSRLFDAEIGDNDVKKMSTKAFKALPKDVLENISETDIAFELGDGYYDYLSGAFYKIIDLKTKKTIGFIEEAWMSYTEDDESLYVTVRYDEKGRRIGEIEY